jgi:small-conductance mechanosensitive channel
MGAAERLEMLQRNVLFVVVLGLLVACVAGVFFTSGGSGVGQTEAAGADAPLVDDRLLHTARSMMSVAETPEEQSLSKQAAQLADHALDQAFAVAIRQAAAAGPPKSGPLKDLSDKVQKLKEQVHVDELAAARAGSDSETVELAKAQLTVDQDELDDAQEDLARRGGDRRSKLERLLKAHEAADQAATRKFGSAPALETLADQVRAWFHLRDASARVHLARDQASAEGASLSKVHDALESAAQRGLAPGSSVAQLREASDQRKSLVSLSKEIQDCQQLVSVYQQWGRHIENRRRDIVHKMLISVAIIIAIVLAVMAATRFVRQAFHHLEDRRSLHHIRVLSTVAVQVVGAMLVLLVIFGAPNQLSAIIGLTTAGLTVALKDFIVAFFGWFALLGKRGIRVGDWVEIEGVSGEVAEIGILKTVLLEIGDWAHTGHPTGRHVSFMNTFALEGHYFNFSTAGRWFWDSLDMTLPPTGDPYQIAVQIREYVERATEEDAKAAQAEWDRVTRQYGNPPFSAKPAVDLRPSAGGLDISVRYITRAPNRYEVKSRLLAGIVELVHAAAVNPDGRASSSAPSLPSSTPELSREPLAT